VSTHTRVVCETDCPHRKLIKWMEIGGLPEMLQRDLSSTEQPAIKNYCIRPQESVIIRSGQDWSDTLPEDRKLYLETMHPVLRKGMNFYEIAVKKLDAL
jgi:hypothetical protein